MKKKKKLDGTFWLFIAPVLICFAMVQIVPFGMGIFYSFTNWTATASGSLEFVGFKNYLDVFKDISFLYSTIITCIYTVLNLFFVNIISFSLALLVTSKIKGKNFYRAGFFLPNVIGGIILGYIWQFIFNNLLPTLGTALGLSWLADNLMLANPNSALIALVIVSSWQYAGYIMMIYVAALQNVPKDLLEAAEIDGATWWQRFRNVTIPMVMPAFTVTLFLTLVNSFKQFDVNVSLTGPGPATFFMGRTINGTELLAQNIANTSMVMRNTALAQSKAIIFFIVLVAFSLIQVYLTKKKEIEL